jgi:hypothetical protein
MPGTILIVLECILSLLIKIFTEYDRVDAQQFCFAFVKPQRVVASIEVIGSHVH